MPAGNETPPDWILLKMSLPVAQGDLWHGLIEGFAHRLVGVVSAEELRHECVAISRGLSWERTIEELRDGLLGNPALASFAYSVAFTALCFVPVWLLHRRGIFLRA